MRRIGTQAGDSKLGCVFWLLIVLVFGLVLKEVFPVKSATMKLEDFMEELAMTKPRAPQHFFEKALYDRARELGLDVDKKEIKVRKYKERVIMDIEFVQRIEILSFTYDWNVDLHLDREIFLL